MTVSFLPIGLILMLVGAGVLIEALRGGLSTAGQELRWNSRPNPIGARAE
jgi:hypothetical protein